MIQLVVDMVAPERGGASSGRRLAQIAGARGENQAGRPGYGFVASVANNERFVAAPVASWAVQPLVFGHDGIARPRCKKALDLRDRDRVDDDGACFLQFGDILLESSLDSLKVREWFLVPAPISAISQRIVSRNFCSAKQKNDCSKPRQANQEKVPAG
jgi:hypothetical protein